MTQTDQILQLLQDGQPHSNGEMALGLHILRYGKCIHLLRQAGYNIITIPGSNGRYDYQLKPKTYIQQDFLNKEANE